MTDEVIERALSEFVDAVAAGDEDTVQASLMFLPADVIARALASFVVLLEKQRDDAVALFRSRIDVREQRILRERVVRQQMKIENQAAEIQQLIREARRRRVA